MAEATVAAALRVAAEALTAIDGSPRLDAELLMAHALGVTRSDMLLRHPHAPSPPGFAALLARRRAHEPVAYIVGSQEFFGLTFAVTPAVLIPRADSETLVRAALAAKPDAQRVLDCGVGSGALLLAVLSELPGATGVGIDRSAAALAIARANADRLGMAARAEMELLDWEAPGALAACGRFDLVLANPPYVAEGEPLPRAVRGYEPGSALFAGADGLDAYRVLLPQLAAVLAPGGVAVVETGASQADAVAAIAADVDLWARLHRDLGGRPRALELSARA